MNTEIIKKEVSYRTARSGGKGGQNVNKVETKVEIIFDPIASAAFSEEQKLQLLNRLATQLTKDGLLQLTAQEERSQLANKEIVEKKLFTVLRDALKVEKERKPTKVPKGVIVARRKNKALNGIKKSTRKKVSISKEDTDLFFVKKTIHFLMIALVFFKNKIASFMDKIKTIEFFLGKEYLIYKK